MRNHARDHSAAPPGDHAVDTTHSNVVGTWVWTAASNLHVLDHGAAEIMTGKADLADTELPLETVIQRLHPDDRVAFLAAVERTERESGPVIVEYRVETPEGTRWLLDHGRTYPASAGMPAHGHGVLIDITRQKLFGAEEAAPSLSPLDRAARHAIATRRAIDDGGTPLLRHLVDMLLWELGRTISRRLQAARNKGMN